MKSNSDDARRFERAIAICAPLMKVIDERTKLELLVLIALRPRCVTELRDCTSLESSLVSHHLRSMRKAGLIQFDAVGRHHVFRLVEEIALGVRGDGEMSLRVRHASGAGFTLHLPEGSVPPRTITEI